MTKAVKLHGGTRTTHGGFTYLTTGRLPEHRREVERYLTAARECLIKDLAGVEGKVTTAQIILIDRAIGKLGILRCIEEFIKEHSVFEGPELAPCLGRSYLGYSNSLRLDLQALGVDKRAEERILGPLEIAAEIDQKKEILSAGTADVEPGEKDYGDESQGEGDQR